MPAYDLTMKATHLEVLWLFHQLVDQRVIRINFHLNPYKDKLGSKDKIYYICSFYINLDL
jgi:hypothetical protein